MSRPLYESDQDLSNEKAVIETVSEIWNCSFAKLPIRYHLDYVATHNAEVLGFCEIKVRNYTMDAITDMGGYLLSYGKWCSAKTLCDASGLPFVLIVKTMDDIWWASFHKFLAKNLVIRGRKDRGDWQDMEPCVLINTKLFKKVRRNNV
jgi:hypothetical protein